jgi:hypothetical protein
MYLPESNGYVYFLVLTAHVIQYKLVVSKNDIFSKH